MVDHYETLMKDILGRGSPLTRFVMAVHGKKTQAHRQRSSDRFRQEDDAVLITTDVVARGMDFPNVSHVFQIGPPTEVSSYIHRIGRTARIGNSGTSYLYYTDHMRSFVDALVKENIRPNLSTFVEDEEFKPTFSESMESSFSDEDQIEEFVSSLMSYMTNFKSQFPLDSKRFLDDMDPFVKLLGLDQLNLSGQLQMAWRNNINNSGFNRKGKGSWNQRGSSRKNRMRF